MTLYDNFQLRQQQSAKSWFSTINLSKHYKAKCCMQIVQPADGPEIFYLKDSWPENEYSVIIYPPLRCSMLSVAWKS